MLISLRAIYRFMHRIQDFGCAESQIGVRHFSSSGNKPMFNKLTIAAAVTAPAACDNVTLQAPVTTIRGSG